MIPPGSGVGQAVEQYELVLRERMREQLTSESQSVRERAESELEQLLRVKEAELALKYGSMGSLPVLW